MMSPNATQASDFAAAGSGGSRPRLGPSSGGEPGSCRFFAASAAPRPVRLVRGAGRAGRTPPPTGRRTPAPRRRSRTAARPRRTAGRTGPTRCRSAGSPHSYTSPFSGPRLHRPDELARDEVPDQEREPGGDEDQDRRGRVQSLRGQGRDRIQATGSARAAAAWGRRLSLGPAASSTPAGSPASTPSRRSG